MEKSDSFLIIREKARREKDFEMADKIKKEVDKMCGSCGKKKKKKR